MEPTGPLDSFHVQNVTFIEAPYDSCFKSLVTERQLYCFLCYIVQRSSRREKLSLFPLFTVPCQRAIYTSVETCTHYIICAHQSFSC